MAPGYPHPSPVAWARVRRGRRRAPRAPVRCEVARLTGPWGRALGEDGVAWLGRGGGCVDPGLPGEQGQILGARPWGQELSYETGPSDLQSCLDWGGGAVTGTSGPPPLPLHLLALPGIVGREEALARLER